jgi:hypothetical protein
MKFCWFHLMPYTLLPDNFREKYPSVWVDIPRELFDPASANRMYNDFMDELEFADAQGFDAVCVNEHHSTKKAMSSSARPTKWQTSCAKWRSTLMSAISCCCCNSATWAKT